MKYKRILKYSTIVIVALALLVSAGLLLLRFYPTISALMQPEQMEVFREWLRSHGVGGALLLMGAQTLQVISGIVPALPIQIAAGLTYGAFWGLLVCLSGVALGSTLVFLAVKRFGQPLIERVVPQDKLDKIAFLGGSKRLEPIVFILYLIPAMPKDVFNYFAALTPLTLRRYLTIMLIARIPTILCSTFASDALMEGDYVQAGIVFCITAVMGLLCMLCSNRILGYLKRKK